MGTLLVGRIENGRRGGALDFVAVLRAPSDMATGLPAFGRAIWYLQ